MRKNVLIIGMIAFLGVLRVEAAIKVLPAHMTGTQYQYKLTFEDLERGKSGFQPEYTTKMLCVQDGKDQAARRFWVAESGGQDAELIYKFDFSALENSPSKVRVYDRLTLGADSNSVVNADIAYSIDGKNFTLTRNEKSSGQINKSQWIDLPASVKTFYYRVRFHALNGKFAGYRNQWARCAPGETAFELSFSTDFKKNQEPRSKLDVTKLNYTLRLTSGTNHLIHAGMYRLYVKMFGAAPKLLPAGWTATTFEEVPEGVIFAINPWGPQDGRDNMIIHPPYREQRGITYIEYDLDLPAIKPIRFDVGFAMMKDKVAKSDGVTFRVKIIGSDQQERTLYDRHYNNYVWQDFSADISSYSGEKITLRLESDPGPDRNAGWDYALFSDPMVKIGPVKPDEPSLRAKLIAADRPENVFVGNAGNTNRTGVCPTTCGQYTNSMSCNGHNVTWECHDSNGDRMVCRWDTTKPYLSGLTVEYRGEKFLAAANSGPVFPENGEWQRELQELKTTDNSATIVEKFTIGKNKVVLTTELSMQGRSLRIATDADRPGLSAINYGGLHGIPWMTSLNIPYLRIKQFAYLHNANAYLSFIQDWSDSWAGKYAFREMGYPLDTKGYRNRIHELSFVTLAPSLAEILPNLPNPPSPFRENLADQLITDLWRGSFADQSNQMEKLRGYGIERMFVIKHIWQRLGLDDGFPAMVPANETMGGDQGLRSMSLTAKRCGYGFGVHDNYVDFYDNSTDWNPSDVVLDSEGRMSPAWKNNKGRQSYNMKAQRMGEYAMRHASEIRARYETTGTFIDVHASTAPWERPFDMEHGQPLAGMFRNSYLGNIALYQQLRAVHQGPVFSEGGLTHFLWAGYLDGVEGAVPGGENVALLVDFELLKIKPLQLNRGMGYYERFLQTGYDSPEWPHFPGSGIQQDKYRAAEVAYGHLGLLSCQLFNLIPAAVREYNLVTPLSKRYGLAPVTEIAYEIDGKMVSGGIAAVLGGAERVKIRYADGLTLRINLSDKVWQNDGETTAPYGFLGKGPECLVGNVIRDGFVCDYRNADGVIYANPRSYNEFTATARMADAEILSTEIQPSGNRKFKFINTIKVLKRPDVGGRMQTEFGLAGQVKFRLIHDKAKPLESWTPGEIIVDGPYEVAIPADAPNGDYKLWTMLPTNGLSRPDLFGYRKYNAETYAVNTPMIQLRQDGLAVIPATPLPQGTSIPARSNRNKRHIDFGTVCTDSAVIIKSGTPYSTIMPVPHGEKVDVELRIDELGWKKIIRCDAVDQNDRFLGNVPLKINGNRYQLKLENAGAVEYRLYHQ